MRVIAGAFKGRRLVAPRGLATRPTADRIKESIFNILAGEIAKKRVLDLFAGTGALGIEALSRGASFSVFVDKKRAAIETIRQNIQTLKLTDRARIVKWDVQRNLHFMKSESKAFDVVFMDPPYETNALNPVLSSLATCEFLSSAARIVVEHSFREQVEPLPASLVLTDQRRFGKTLVSFINPVL
jgi:16S rRNA (guanine966-N2)-methyltransferase